MNFQPINYPAAPELAKVFESPIALLIMLIIAIIAIVSSAIHHAKTKNSHEAFIFIPVGLVMIIAFTIGFRSYENNNRSTNYYDAIKQMDNVALNNIKTKYNINQLEDFTLLDQEEKTYSGTYNNKNTTKELKFSFDDTGEPCIILGKNGDDTQKFIDSIKR